MSRAGLSKLARGARVRLGMEAASRDVRVTTGSAVKDGSCNACKQMNEHGRTPYDTVVRIKLGGCEVRLCYDCAAEMLRQMESLR